MKQKLRKQITQRSEIKSWANLGQMKIMGILTLNLSSYPQSFFFQFSHLRAFLKLSCVKFLIEGALHSK